MASEPRAVEPSEAEVAAPANPEISRDKVRLTFRKADSLRWLSHHDLMRTFERMLHRSCLPFRRSQGFHPHPRLIFALSLPLGVIGQAEIVELELDQLLTLDEIRDRLIQQAPAGLEILTIQRIALNETAQVVGFRYGLVVPAERIAATRARLDANPLVAECWVERTRPSPRRLDIRPFVRLLQLDDATGRLEMDLFLTPQGTARPEEVLSLVGLDGLIASGVPLERVGLELKG
jgi:radical SAM-linked protein